MISAIEKEQCFLLNILNINGKVSRRRKTKMVNETELKEKLTFVCSIVNLTGYTLKGMGFYKLN